MNYVVLAWTLVLGMCVWAIYLYFAWSGVETLPMQWGVNGKPNWYATRGVAVALFPLLAACILAVLTFAARPRLSGPGVLLTTATILVIQAAWVILARRYV